jgi:CheY-like chemotaxis protein
MKVLVVDDNIAIQEILKDILIDDGHIVRIAGTIDDAVNTILDFHPNAILLDAVVNDEDGVQILQKAHEEDQELELNTVLIKSSNDEIPTDTTFIKAVVNKPFKSSDISSALATLQAQKEEEMNQAQAPKGFLGRIKKNKKDERKPADRIAKDDAALVAEYISGEGPMFGRSYVFFEEEPDRIYEFIDIFTPVDYSVLVISSDNAKAVTQNYRRDSIEVVTLTSSGRGKSMLINELGTLTVYIMDYIKQHNKPIVVIDNFTDIIDSNGLNHSLVFIHQLINREDRMKVSFVLSVDPSIMTTKDRNILLSDMSEYSN